MVPDYIRPGDVQNLGTGAALTSFLPLPGGGFYDNYRDKTSPQGIRPISKSGIFYGTADELEAEINLWRAKLGKRGRLAVEWDNGALRWQWARLQNLDTPRPREAKGGWLPFTMTWITAAQNWRGVVYSEEDWTVDDGSFVIGDGSAEIGVGAQTFAITANNQEVMVTHNGTIDAPNVTLRLDISGTWQDLTVINETTGQQFILVRSASDQTPMLEINAGARSIYLVGAPKAISTIYRDHDGIEIVTASAHGIVSSDTVRIEGTNEYDGDYYPIGANTTTELNYNGIPHNARAYGTVNAGTVRKLSDAYDDTVVTDKAEWMVLASGGNVLRFSWSPFPSSATLTVEFVDHYA